MHNRSKEKRRKGLKCSKFEKFSVRGLRQPVIIIWIDKHKLNHDGYLPPKSPSNQPPMTKVHTNHLAKRQRTQRDRKQNKRHPPLNESTLRPLLYNPIDLYASHLMSIIEIGDRLRQLVHRSFFVHADCPYYVRVDGFREGKAGYHEL
jgi:hypothetical protein